MTMTKSKLITKTNWESFHRITDNWIEIHITNQTLCAKRKNNRPKEEQSPKELPLKILFMSVLPDFEVEVGLVHLLDKANLSVSAFKEHHVLNIQVAEVVTTEDLLGWTFTSRQCARFFKYLNKWQQMRDHVVSQNLWDEMKNEIERTGICSCEQLKEGLCSASLQCSVKEQMVKSLCREIKKHRAMTRLTWNLKK